jgi:hypothetical protein
MIALAVLAAYRHQEVMPEPQGAGCYEESVRGQEAEGEALSRQQKVGCPQQAAEE